MQEVRVSHGHWLDVAVSRTLVFVCLTAVAVAVYAIAVGLLGHQVLSDSALGVLLGAVMAAVLQPALGAARRGVDWLLYGDRADPYRVIVRTGEAVQSHSGGQGLVQALVESVRDALRLSHVRVAPADGPAVATMGDPRGREYEFGLRYHGSRVGTLTVGRSGDLLTRGDQRLLAGVLPLLAAALDSMRREAELRGVREQLVVAHEEERRRLRRELHDGLGPALAAASLGLDAARVRLRRDPEAGDALLAGIQSELRESVGEMRRLIDQLRPAVLDQAGLLPAVRQQVATLCGSGVDGRVDVEPADGLGELAAAVEVAAYRIAVEAVTNAVRHSGCSRCTVLFSLRDNTLTVTVTDDGRGRGDRPAGVGIRSMTDRAEELGGSITLLDQDSGGCQLIATLPLQTGVPA